MISRFLPKHHHSNVVLRALLTQISRILLCNCLAFTALAAEGKSEEPPPDSFIDMKNLKNFSSIAKATGLASYYKARENRSSRKIRVAVIDYSFAGYEKALGRTLPTSVYFFPGMTNEGEKESANPHGLKMAEIVWAFTTQQGQRLDYEPEFYLFQMNTTSNTYTNFVNAIDIAIRLKVDIVLHAIVRDYGNNFDGQGLFNDQVNRALDAGITWINAAGNYADTTFNFRGPFKLNEYDYVELPTASKTLKVLCHPPEGKTSCVGRFALSWNSYSQDMEAGTDKDLDLSLSIPYKEISPSEMRQTTDQKLAPGQTKFPREIIVTEMKLKSGQKEGVFYLNVKDVSKNFTRNDRVRITAEGEGLFFDSTDRNESILNPADNPRVITVGALDSERSSRSIKLGKPDISTVSILQFQTKERFAGSSNSSALVTAAAALLMQKTPDLNRTQLLKLMKGVGPGADPIATGIDAGTLGFQPPNKGGCFPVKEMTSPNQYVKIVLDNGGVFVETNQGIKIMTPADPLSLSPGSGRANNNDMVVIASDGLQIVERKKVTNLRSGAYEVFAWPADYGPCSIPEQWSRIQMYTTATGPQLYLQSSSR